MLVYERQAFGSLREFFAIRQERASSQLNKRMRLVDSTSKTSAPRRTGLASVRAVDDSRRCLAGYGVNAELSEPWIMGAAAMLQQQPRVFFPVARCQLLVFYVKLQALPKAGATAAEVEAPQVRGPCCAIPGLRVRHPATANSNCARDCGVHSVHSAGGSVHNHALAAQKITICSHWLQWHRCDFCRLHWRRCSLSTRGVTAPRCFCLLAPSLCWSNRLAAGLIPACRRSVCRGRGALPPAVGVPCLLALVPGIVFVTEDKQEQLIVNRVGAGQAVLPPGHNVKHLLCGLGVNSTKHSMGLAAHEKEQQQVKEQVT